MSIRKESLPFIAPLILLTIFIGWWDCLFAFIPIIFIVLIAFFFRDPSRTIPSEPDIIVSAADGKVDIIDEIPSLDEHSNAKLKRVSVFLSVLDVHINRSPVTGKIIKTQYKQGEFHNAMDGKSSDLNENNLICIFYNGKKVWVRQIAGMIARRIVCYLEKGSSVERGEKIGLIRFGSRTDIYLPLEAEVIVKKGDRVRGGETIIARLK